MDVYITLFNNSSNVGPFNLYSDVDGFLSAFDTNIPLSILEAGYATNSAPDGTTIIRVKSINQECSNFIDLTVNTTTTTTTII